MPGPPVAPPANHGMVRSSDGSVLRFREPGLPGLFYHFSDLRASPTDCQRMGALRSPLLVPTAQ